MIAAKVFRVKKADKDKIIRIPNDPSRREDEWDIIRMFTIHYSVFIWGRARNPCNENHSSLMGRKVNGGTEAGVDNVFPSELIEITH